MKLASYLSNGNPAFGIVTDMGVITLSDRFAGRTLTLKDALTEDDALDELLKLAEGAEPDASLDGLKYLPVITNPSKILCVGINYRSHAAEHGHAVAEKPNIFTKFTDTLVEHEGAMVRPRASQQLDFEGELAVIIGTGGRAIAAKDALSHVAGYTCFCDGSVRDFIKVSLITGKNFPSTSPLGPWMVTADEIPDPSKLTLTTRLNGKEMQRSGTDMMMHGVPELIAYCSTFTELSPGDVIATGTPEGIGARRNPPVWMKAGDVLEVEISGIGMLRSQVVNEA
ncbi:MAG TPA: fumarylacetoacetate hydrolase family protein [Micropepsaceae bacterium]|jgi:2-keto-4-pentenoate hydratase/2-oxohepta-3-ene-1,7-dioic acid hydratase in catechol pathway|nr:fumarylacetoacetate hydrolase family protein [Micropepsaceae bacterium]